MRYLFAAIVGLVVLAAPALAEEPKGKLVQETWHAAYLDGNKAGYVHTTVREVEKDSKKLLHTAVVLDLTVKRFEDTLKATLEQSTIETPEGKVVGVGMSQTLGKQQVLVLTGTVEGKQLRVKVEGQVKSDKKIPWDEDVIGLYREQQLFKSHKVKPGDTFSYKQYIPGFNSVFNVNVTVGEPEEVTLPNGKRKLLRADASAEKIEGVQPPKTSYWLDKDLQVVRLETAIEGWGKLTLALTTKEVALAPVAVPAKMTDVGVSQLIPLKGNKRLPKSDSANEAVYRIVIKGDDEAATAFAQDARQTVQNAKKQEFELVVKAIREPQKVEKPDAKAAEEFSKSNFFINCDDRNVKDHAHKAIGKETEDWKKVQLITKYVHKTMKVLNFREAMATADHVAKTLEGDCTEYAMLTAAMLRSAGVPSRTAIGLVYVDNSAKGPALAYHMWTEAWVKGQWIAVDSVIGQVGVGATHLKITDHSWFETESLKPMLPVMRVTLNKPTVEVLSVNGKK